MKNKNHVKKFNKWIISEQSAIGPIAGEVASGAATAAATTAATGTTAAASAVSTAAATISTATGIALATVTALLSDPVIQAMCLYYLATEGMEKVKEFLLDKAKA